MSNLGETLEQRGWLQGAFISNAESKKILESAVLIDIDESSLEDDEWFFIVVSQSCNIANNTVATLQLAIGRALESRNKAKEYNKHPREIHSLFTKVEHDGSIEEINFSVNILEKAFIPKKLLLDVNFLDDIKFNRKELNSFVEWLGSHYTKPALPTTFNNLVNTSNKKKEEIKRKSYKPIS